MQSENKTEIELYRPQFGFMAFVILVALFLTLLHCFCKGGKGKSKPAPTEAQKVESFINHSQIKH